MVIISNQHHNFNNFIKVINEESNLTVACNIIEKSFEYINEEKAKLEKYKQMMEDVENRLAQLK